MKKFPFLSLKNIKKSFEDNCVLEDVSLNIEQGQNLVLLGINGCGKTVLLKCIAGLYPIDSGSILIKGIETTSLSFSKRQEVLSPFGMLFQQGALFDSLTVVENIAFSLTHGLETKKKESLDIATESLKQVGLKEDVANLYPAELSGGMKRRVALARTLVNSPQLVLFDDPTTGLDPILTNMIGTLIFDYVKKNNAAAITITHDLINARKIAHQIGLIFKGKIIWTGTIQDLDKTDNPYVNQFIKGRTQGPFHI